MRPATLGLCVLVLLAHLTAAHAQGGRLQKIRDEAGGKSPERTDEPRSSNGNSRDDEGEGFLSLFLSGLFASSADDDKERSDGKERLHATTFYLPYPYAHGKHGPMHFIEHESKDTPPADLAMMDRLDAKSWSIRLALEESNDFDGLNRVNGQLLLTSMKSIFGLQTSWMYLQERLPGERTDTMLLGDVNLVVNFSTPWLELRYGVGGRFLFDRGTDEYGVNATIGLDIYPCRPWVLSAQLDFGTVGDTWVSHVRATLGYTWKHWEFYGGYDYLNIGSVALQGPVLGVRLWF